ncbi:hypothetical protein ASZ90_007661 [hydrocarbon metagenome]|uniref:Uncharacterized protein n=1 Tax=hydrocarbon metagenome TaxID=938273 RepID=A0A0W8FP27_9ZZZZ
MYRSQRILEIAVAAVAFVAQPFGFRTPVDVLFRFPDILTTATEAECLEAHCLQSDVAGQYHQIGPGYFPAVFLLDRPEQTACLVEVHVVRPAVEGCKTLIAGAATAAAIAGAVSSRAVPGHADHQPTIVAPIGRPPFLRIGHQRREIFLNRREIKFLEFLAVVETLAHRIGLGGMLMQNIEFQLIRPPVTVRRAFTGYLLVCPARYRALTVFIHNVSSFYSDPVKLCLLFYFK